MATGGKPKKAPSEFQRLTEIAKFLKLISDKNRMRILFLVRKDFMTVTQIHKTLKLAQNLTSHHIGQLKKFNLLVEQREGAFRRYKINDQAMRAFSKEFGKMLEMF